jgi:hypothetical protein
MTTIEALSVENQHLKLRIESLQNEIAFLRKHPSFARGLRGETVAHGILGGGLTNKNASHDLTLADGRTVEVKFSALNTPHLKSNCRRWTWKNPLGWKNQSKTYDYLLLMGERDNRFPEQYRDNDVYVMFLIPYSYVIDIMVKSDFDGGSINLTSNLIRHRSPRSQQIVSHRVYPEAVASQMGINVGALLSAQALIIPDDLRELSAVNPP